MSFLYVDSSTDNRSCLHLRDFRIGNCKTASTMPHHRVELVQTVDDRFNLLYSLALSVSQFLNVLFLCRNELMQRRIQETDRYRVAFQSFVKSFEVSLLIWKNFFKRFFSFFFCLRTDHFTECIDSSFTEEHMLCTAKPDTLCTKFNCFLSIFWSICVCTNF